MKRIILASTSPRRRALLRLLGLRFSVAASAYHEDLKIRKNPAALVQELSREKAYAIAGQHPRAIIIGADTVVAVGKEILGKPSSGTEARRQLERLNGRTHTVLTGFTILDTETGRHRSRAVRTKVVFGRLSPDEIARYVRGNYWRGFAGAYAIQKRGGVFVQKIEGDYFNIVGLPLHALAQELKEFGVDTSVERAHAPNRRVR